MLANLLRIVLVLALWPLIVSSLLAMVYVWALSIQVPRIRHRYGGIITADVARWFGLIAGLTFVGVAAGTVLVIQAPTSNYPSFFDLKPITWIGLGLSAWSTFLFVLATERTSARSRKHDELMLNEVLEPWEPLYAVK